MTSREFQDRLLKRARLAGVSLPPSIPQQFEDYFRLLARWNARINLTSLPVEKPTDEALDRLLVEPLAAASHFTDSAQVWLDLGSGGGSPAIPLKLLHPSVALTMVEAKARKAAFLREAIRTLGLRGTDVETARFEELASRPDYVHKAQLVTIRAVRTDENLFSAASKLLVTGGRLLMFRSREPGTAVPEGFRLVETVHLLPRRPSYLASLEAL